MTFTYEFSDDDISKIADLVADRIVNRLAPATITTECAWESEIFNSRQVQAFLKISASTLARRRKEGSIPFVQHGGVITYLKSDLDEWLRNKRNRS